MTDTSIDLTSHFPIVAFYSNNNILFVQKMHFNAAVD